ncbi:putative Protein kinase [Zostera marina]|uniref:Protein kinase domain-containing protein n=1 Tax=Zostera marina TaxID=29655 RepID=A0A0K9PDY9_ZOSMR|nr:putative Protein kinase [Zostera marina]
MSRGVEYSTSTTLQALLVFLAFLFVVAVDGQKPEGFISIDCGQEKSYNDTVTGLSYVSDSDFIDTGENHKIPTNMNATNQQGYHLRSFPNGTRNCYRLPVVKDKKYLIRASFFYANYDGLNQTPQFDLYLDVNLWESINSEATIHYFTEILAYASRNWMFVCVVDTGSGVPFISSLESRQLGDNFLYPLVMSNQSSVLFQRRNIQPIKDEILRYPIDEYDRRWRPYTSDSLETLSTTKKISMCKARCIYPAPLDVFQTCGVSAANGSTINITFQWPLNNKKSRKVYMVIYYAEIQNLASDQSRNFSAFGNLDYWTENQAYPGYLHSGIYRSVNIGTLNDPFVTFILRTANGTTLPPIISGIEVYEVHDLTALISTKDEEVEDMLELKEFYKLTKNWQGDPCVPKDYVWEGVECSSENLNSSIISLNLSFSGLSGGIAETFKNFKLLKSLILSNNMLSGKIPYLEVLKNLQTLDLSNNNLNGNIPYFLMDLPKLNVLNLSGNNLSGLVPEMLQQKANDEGLQMDLKGNPYLCFNSEECEASSSSSSNSSSNTKIIIIIVAVVCSVIAAAIVTILFVAWKVRRRNSNPNNSSLLEVSPIGPTNKKFTYHDLVTMTNNFDKRIGKGGIGHVFHGIDLRNGSQANLLTRIHHKNLVSLVGYCIDKDHLALVYEYMEGGSLKDHLSGHLSNSKTISWGNRMRIALEAAQGLEYMHRGCKPAIVHRDVKSDNILLSRDFEVKIADFGLSKIFEKDPNSCMSTIVMGTFGYIDPEYYDTQMLNEKSDVYSFGVVLLELITGQPAIIHQMDERIHLARLVEPKFEMGEIDKIVDPKLNNDFDTNSAWKALEVAFQCILPTSIQRPLMFDVVKQLKECLEFETPQGSRSRDIFQSIDIDHGSDSITAPYAR